MKDKKRNNLKGYSCLLLYRMESLRNQLQTNKECYLNRKNRYK